MFLLVLICVLTILGWLWRPFYWAGSGLKYLIPYPIVGNAAEMLRNGAFGLGRYLYEAFPDEKMFGFHFFTAPTLLIRDPEIAVDVLVKDFDHFTSNGFPSSQKYDFSAGNLLFLYGMQWKEMRAKVSPFFTPAKVKAMMSSLDITMPKALKLTEHYSKTGEPFDIGYLLGQITNDVITQSCFGVESDAFEKNSLFQPLASIFFSFKFNVMMNLKSVLPKLFEILRLQTFDLDSSLFLKKITKDLVEHRKKNNIKGNDFLQGIIEIMNKYSQKEDGNNKIEYFEDGTRVPKYDFDEMFLQALIIFIGGVESTANMMTWMFYELAQHQHLQDRCREEILEVVKRTGKNVTLNDQSEIPTIIGAINETVRLYPAFLFASRCCTKTYKFRNVDLTVQPGQRIFIATEAMQRDPQYFSNPDTFDPQRWQGEKPGLITTFGLGPKMCLGKSFATYEMILVVSQLLRNYKFTLNPKTESPPRRHKTKPINCPATPIWMDITRVQN